MVDRLTASTGDRVPRSELVTEESERYPPTGPSTMNKANFKQIDSEEAFVEILKQHQLFREDDVVFDDLSDGKLYVYTGDDFQVDTDLLESMEIGGLLVEGSVRAESISVSDILGDAGVFCVTGDLRCRDMLYMTEMTGVGIGQDLVIDNFFYSDCGNSGLQVNGNLTAKLFFNFQCEIDVRGEENVQLDESASADELVALGLPVADGERPNAALQRYFKVGNYRDA